MAHSGHWRAACTVERGCAAPMPRPAASRCGSAGEACDDPGRRRRRRHLHRHRARARPATAATSRSSSPRCPARRTTSPRRWSTASSRSAASPASRPATIDAVFHGTTVATNMVIERDGAEVGMITTRGFRDILHMARHKRPHNFSLQFDVPWQSKPLVQAPQPHRGHRADHAARRHDRGAARRGRGASAPPSCSPSAARGGDRRLPVLVPQQRARAARPRRS